jgi:hypothetical protein
MGLAGTSLRIHTVKSGQRFGRISLSRYPNPLGYGKTPSRFSDPRRCVAANRFGVLYLGESLKVCFVETVLRDQRDGAIGDLPMEEAELHHRYYAEIEIAEPLALVDMREDGAVVMGVPTDVVKASTQTLARAWSVAFYEHPEQPDGIIYPSRLIGQTNLAVFDRATTKLRAVQKTKLIAVTGLAGVLNDLRVSILSPDP